MTKFIPHEIQPSLAAEHHGGEADELMKSDTALDDRVAVRLGHVPIHFLIHQPECERLITDKRLVMALCVGDGCFTITTVRENSPQLTDVPVLVTAVLEQLDPVVRNAHGEAEGKA